jgi:hypothetical protein
MAITFQADGVTILIGGQESLGGATGLVGPFPRYNISREDVATGAGVYLHSKFSIGIAGTATITGDITTAGERQGAVQGAALTALQANRASWPTIGNGILTISAYGGGGSNIIFDDARIVSLELPEQNEESAGVQNLEYSFTFEATNEGSGGGPDPLVSSVEESWEVTLNEDQGAFALNAINASSPIRSYTMSHSVSATGSRKMNGQNLADDGSAWRQASKYVASRLVSGDPLAIAGGRTNIVNDAARNVGGDFAPKNMDKNGETALGLDLDAATFKSYNHIRTWSNNQGEGSCAVTETWLISDLNQAVTHDVEISLDVSADAPANTVTVNGTIQGLNTGGVSASTEDKYTNAKAALNAVMGNAYAAAAAVYAAVSPPVGGTLRTVEISKSVGHNKVTGTITWSVTYDDLDVSSCITGAISCDINITYDNTDAGNQVVAIIGVIDNAGGPVIQDMRTTNEQKTSVSFDASMDKDHRVSPPTGDAEVIVLGYRPIGSFRESRSETWNPESGQYNLSISWVKTS